MAGGRLFQRMSKSALALASASLHLVAGMEQQRRGQQAGRHAIPAIVGAVELGEVGVPKQAATQRGQQTVEGVLAHVVQVQPVRFPQTPLVRSLSQHSQPSLCLLTPSIARARLPPLPGQISSRPRPAPTRAKRTRRTGLDRPGSYPRPGNHRRGSGQDRAFSLT